MSRENAAFDTGVGQRFIPRETILASVDSFEIIEEYPQDKYLPSYLIYAQHETLIFHVQIAVDVPGDNIRIITAYVPTKDKWEADLKVSGHESAVHHHR